ncbi:hypothetical protein D8Y22_00775 [Salinadaptatus halalkaliphilus]|uniref:DUF304 domain-containing protein n=1 Tax=Salinadaptatus halalkaliphilus TaxID=2419781 RepID=A0A4V3VLR8_9EURY|nr:hypothetical protein [Salinadaptatus halalkaliphilus]THE66697.1 hypothetical protein D8Y22_00775 [Salinadaptatus halalkaliphilus]
MAAENTLREAEEEMKRAEPSRGLKNQVPPDEEIQWVAKQDLRTAWFSLILHKLKVMVMMLVAGFVAAIFAIGVGGPLLGLLTFLVVGIGAPAGYIVYKYNYLQNTTIEYAATDEQFIKYKETPSTTRSESLPINRAKTAKFRQDRWDKMLDTGDIHIQGIGRAGNLSINDVPNSEAVHRMAQQQIAGAEQVDDVGGMQQGRVQQGTVGR